MFQSKICFNLKFTTSYFYINIPHHLCFEEESQNLFETKSFKLKWTNFNDKRKKFLNEIKTLDCTFKLYASVQNIV